MSGDLIVQVRLKADGSGLVGEVRVAKAELDKLARGAGDAGKDVGKLGATSKATAKDARALAAETGVLGAAFGGLARGILTAAAAYLSLNTAQRMMDEFRASEQAVAALDQSIASMGRTTAGLSTQLQALASQIQSDGIIDDDVIVKGQSFLTTYGAITDDMLPRATRLMADLSAKMGGDVVSAANMVGKASIGMASELNRVGIQVSDAAVKSGDLSRIFGEMEQQVGGMNAALGYTAGGAFTQFNNALGDMRENAGGMLTIGLAEFFREAAKEMAAASTNLRDGADAVQDFAAKTVTAMAFVYDYGIKYLILGFQTVQLTAIETVRGIVLAFQALNDATPDWSPFKANSEALQSSLDDLRVKSLGLTQAMTGIARTDAGKWAEEYNAKVKQSYEAMRIMSDRTLDLVEKSSRLDGQFTAGKISQDAYTAATGRLAIEMSTAGKGAGALNDAQQKQMDTGKKLVEDLQFELAAMKMSDAERQVAINLRKLEGAAAKQHGDAVADLTRKLEAERQVKAAGDYIKNIQEEIRLTEIRINLGEDEYEVQKELAKLKGATPEQLDSAEQMIRHQQGVNRELKASEEATKRWGKIWDNAIENMQRSFGDFVYKALWEDGVRSFSDFGKAIIDIWKKAIAEMVAAWITSGIAELFASWGGNREFNWGNVFGGSGGGSGGGGMNAGTAVSMAQTGYKLYGAYEAGATNYATSGSISEAISAGFTKYFGGSSTAGGSSAFTAEQIAAASEYSAADLAASGLSDAAVGGYATYSGGAAEGYTAYELSASGLSDSAVGGYATYEGGAVAGAEAGGVAGAEGAAGAAASWAGAAFAAASVIYGLWDMNESRMADKHYRTQEIEKFFKARTNGIQSQLDEESTLVKAQTGEMFLEMQGTTAEYDNLFRDLFGSLATNEQTMLYQLNEGLTEVFVGAGDNAMLLAQQMRDAIAGVYNEAGAGFAVSGFARGEDIAASYGDTMNEALAAIGVNTSLDQITVALQGSVDQWRAIIESGIAAGVGGAGAAFQIFSDEAGNAFASLSGSTQAWVDFLASAVPSAAGEAAGAIGELAATGSGYMDDLSNASAHAADAMRVLLSSGADAAAGAIVGLGGIAISTFGEMAAQAGYTADQISQIVSMSRSLSGFSVAQIADVAAGGSGAPDGPNSAFGGFADGGIASGPSSGYWARMHGTEAIVPLPSGGAIPVAFQGGGGGADLNAAIDRLIAAQEALDARADARHRDLAGRVDDLEHTVGRPIARAFERADDRRSTQERIA